MTIIIKPTITIPVTFVLTTDERISWSKPTAASEVLPSEVVVVIIVVVDMVEVVDVDEVEPDVTLEVVLEGLEVVEPKTSKQ